MPDNRQARTDDMPDGKKNHHKTLTTIIMVVVFLGIIGFIGLT